MKQLAKIVLPVFVMAFIIAACSEDNDTTGSTGNLSIQLTDAPFPSDLVSEANVIFDRIEIRKADEAEGSPFIVLSEEEMSFNLLDLTNGVTASLVDLEIEVGSYDLIRLYVSEANVVLGDGGSFDLNIPSGSQTGIKIFIDPSIEVAGGLTAELLLDFDVSQSFVPQGNPNSADAINGFTFKPTIKAANLTTSGRLAGVVTDSLGTVVDGATISVFAADTLNTSALANESGEYTILGLTAGIYDVTVEYGEYSAVTFDEVEIVAGNVTTQDAQLTE